MKYTVNPDGSVNINKQDERLSVKYGMPASQIKESWDDYAKDLNKSENS